MELKFIEKKEKVTEEARCTRETYTIGVYTVNVVTRFYANGASLRNIEVVKPWNTDREDFTPEINYCDGNWGETPYFAIQTTSYGALNAVQFKKFLDAQQAALEIVEILNEKLA